MKQPKFSELLVYQKAFALAMQIFEVSKRFPKVEKYSLTDQIRRSSRSVCAQIAEGYRKRRYPKHFISKLTDGDAENAETQVWLQFSLSCQYITEEEYEDLLSQSFEVGKLYLTRSGLGKFPINSVSIYRTRNWLGCPNHFDVGILGYMMASPEKYL